MVEGGNPPRGTTDFRAADELSIAEADAASSCNSLSMVALSRSQYGNQHRRRAPIHQPVAYKQLDADGPKSLP